jgi:hypothetical protein
MTLRLLKENVLTSDADAILLPIDGQARGLGGSVARAFARKWPRAHERFESRLQFPVALGDAACVTTDSDCRWNAVIFLAILNHLQLLDEVERSAVMTSALSKALSIGISAGFGSMATVILRGGWRLPSRTALSRMKDVYKYSEFGRQGRRLNVCCLDRHEYQAMESVIALRETDLTAVDRKAAKGRSPD